jgi:hypothetical protein
MTIHFYRNVLGLEIKGPENTNNVYLEKEDFDGVET